MRKLIVLALAVGGIPLVAIKSSRSSAEGAATPLSQMVFTQLATDEFYGTKIALALGVPSRATHGGINYEE
jgi:hypothetical protein